MKINCYQISDGPQLTPCEYNVAIDAIRQHRVKVWIDIQDLQNHELEEKLNDLNVQGMVRRLCLETRDHPGFYPLQPLTLLVMPVHTDSKDSANMEYLSFLYSQDFLFSYRNSEMSRFQKDLTLQESVSLLPDGSIAGIISSLCFGLSLVSLRNAAFLCNGILSLEVKRERAQSIIQVEEISDRQLEMLALESVVQGQLPIVQALLSTGSVSLNSENIRNYLRWASTNLESANRTLEWLERRTDVMRSLVDANAQDKTNRRLGRLTVLSTIFMPITFLVGVWGMNFAYMPFLTNEYGYLIALSTMGIIALGMYFYFRKRGWFE